MRATGRRRAKEPIAAADRRPPPPTPTNNAADPWQFISTPGGAHYHRDSDASFASSRPSSAGGRPSILPTTDKASAIRTINAFLAAHSLPFSLKPPLPSAKDITETLKFLLHRLGFVSQKLDDELNLVLKSLKCPLKMNKSALRAPGTPHSWPNLLAVIHWLVQTVKFQEHLVDSSKDFEDNGMMQYAINSYMHFIKGDDDAVEALDEKFMGELRHERNKMEESMRMMEGNVKEMEARLEGLKSGPSQKESLEQEKALLEKDVEKFHIIIKQCNDRIAEAEKKLEEKDKELEVKVEERKRICEENEQLKTKIEEQGINARDAERMRRELQAVDRNIEEVEVARNGWEEKIWDLELEIGHKFKELEESMMENNQFIRRLKIGNGFQYQLNQKGSTPVEVLGSDYKSILKPAVASSLDDIKGSSMEKLEQSITLRKQAAENVAKLEEIRNHIAAVQYQIDEVESHLSLVRRETQDHISRCATEARKMVDEVETDTLNMQIVEKEAAEYMKTSNSKMYETNAQIDKEVQKDAQELFDLINAVSIHKEHVESRIAEMQNHLVESAGAVADIYKGYRPVHN